MTNPSINSPASAEDVAMRPNERLAFSAIVDRKPLALPNGAKLIVWPVVNIEEWDISRPMPRTVSPPPGGVAQVPDLPNWTWHEYGMRVGFWRILKAFEDLGIKPTMSINAKVCETRPRVAQAALDAGWEFMAHCYEQMAIQKVVDQKAMIEQSIEVLTRFTGKKPEGWLGPGRGQTFITLDLIKEAGFKWFGDWVLDEVPQYVKTDHGTLVSIPYSIELNDIGIMLSANQPSDAMLKRTKDSFDCFYEEAQEQGARILTFGIHPYISGVPHRIKYLREMLQYLSSHEGVVFWNGSQIYDWFESLKVKN
jgi:peptidoglycan/xylan/chitin deacetylase (PgdA/CDA1 family)